MFVVLDTTEAYDDLPFEGANFKLLQNYLARNSSRLVIPQVVKDEVVNHYRERVTKLVRDVQSKVKSIRDLVPEANLLPDIAVDIELAVNNFSHLLTKRLKDFGAIVATYEGVSVKSLLARALRRKKPFDGEGRKGFRDAVLWDSILQEVIVKNGGNVKMAVVTGNSKDFGSGGKLFADLSDECESLEAGPGCIRLFNGLGDFVTAEVMPQLEKLDAIQLQLEEGAYKEYDPIEFFASNHPSVEILVQQHIQRNGFTAAPYLRRNELFDPDLGHLCDRAGECKPVDVWGVDEELIAVGVDYIVEGEVMGKRRIEDRYPDGSPEFRVEEFSAEASFVISMTVMIKKETGVVEDYDVNDVDVETSAPSLPSLMVIASHFAACSCGRRAWLCCAT